MAISWTSGSAIKKDFDFMRKSKIVALIIITALLLPLWMWVAWLLTPKKKMVIAIVDKTVLTPDAQEHISLDWVLKHEKYTKNSKDLYRPERDYFGFFPGKDDQFQLKGLERFSPQKLTALSEDANMVYFTDTYGIYTNEWYKKAALAERSGLVYGGMTQQDIQLLTDMKERHKLMIAEFNSIGSPTPLPVRSRFEHLFGLHWSGWTARYFADLDTNSNKELPHWLINNYKAQHDGHWPFRRQGIAFVSINDRVVILQDSSGLTDPLPAVEATPSGLASLDLPREIKYPFWFDIIDSVESRNEVAAWFVIHANTAGKAELDHNGIPARFPAILSHTGNDYRFYYFSGDFCDNPIGLATSYFNGISWFQRLFYDKDDPGQRTGFFWRFYRPMMTRILNDYYRSLPQK
jgi:hypothetical protein